MKQKKKLFEDSIVQKKSDQIMVQKTYLQIIIFLKCTFDIFFVTHNQFLVN
jgi:hypothetical protein